MSREYKELEIDFAIPEILQQDIDDFLHCLNEEGGSLADCYESEIRNILNGCDTCLSYEEVELLRDYYCRGGIYVTGN